MIKRKFILFISQNYSFSILRPLEKVILKRGDDVRWFAYGKEVNRDNFLASEQVLHTIEDIIEFSPDATFYPANIVPTFLPGINVAVFHGFDAGKLDKKGNNDHYKIRNCFDLYCTQGPDSTYQFSKLNTSPQRFQVTETGWCALDDLFPAALPCNDKATILLCSTFSRKLSCAPHLFETIKRLSQTGKWRWMVQFHPKMNKDIVQQYKSIQSEHLTFIETADINPILKQADVMVCDTSSILLTFLLLEKPVVTFKNISPNDHLIDIDDPENLENSIGYALTRPEKLINNIKSFIEKTHPYKDGKSSERVLDAVDLYYQNKAKFVPKKLDLIRQFKMRKSLNYWKFWN